MPDKAIDLIDEAAAGVKLLPANDDEPREVNEGHIEDTVSRMAQIPSKQVSIDDKAALKSLDEDLMKVVFGQEEAVRRLTEAIPDGSCWPKKQRETHWQFPLHRSYRGWQD